MAFTAKCVIAETVTKTDPEGFKIDSLLCHFSQIGVSPATPKLFI